jgi:hypothetical protein
MNLKLQLVFEVEYDTNGVPEGELHDKLRQIVYHAMAEGWVTGDSEAVMVDHRITVKKMSTEV